MNLMIVDSDRKTGNFLIQGMCSLSGCHHTKIKKRGCDEFPALETHEQYYGFSKDVKDPWKNRNIVRACW